MRFLFAGSLLITLMFVASSCFEFPNAYSSVAPGAWRGTLQLVPKFITPNPKGKPLPEKLNLEFEEVTDGELPFNFAIVYDDTTNFHMIIENGEEQIKIDDISIGRDIRTGSDTFRIEFPVFDSFIVGAYEDNVMQGKWVVPYREENGIPYEIPFVARYGEGHRFTTLKKQPIMDISGRWNVRFDINTDEPYPAIGDFQQKGNKVTGTFITETGDYRFLEGTIQDNKVYLSCFDGSHAYLFEAKIKEDHTMIGSFRSGKHFTSVWEAKLSPEATLLHPDSITKVNDNKALLDLAFENTSGQVVNINELFSGKAKVIQLFGTWCPNCRDETNFLLKYLKENNHTDLAIIGVAFERYRDKHKAFVAIDNYKKRMEVPYPILYGGYADKTTISEKLPMINKFSAYPTLIFINKEGRVTRVHTGFYGPATEEYEKFVTDFELYVKELL